MRTLPSPTRSEISLSETVTDETFLETLIREQKLDEELKRVREAIQLKAQGKPINSDLVLGFYKDKVDYCQLVNDVLYYVSYDDKFGSTPYARILVPTSLQDIFLDKSHGDYQSGHPGEKRMKDKLIKFCIWPKMAQSISQKVRR